MAKPEVPDDTTVGFSLEFVWKATSFDRMSGALKLFKDYSASISGYLFHILLGHEVWYDLLTFVCVRFETLASPSRRLERS
jgi:hypothetical protein